MRGIEFRAWDKDFGDFSKIPLKYRIEDMNYYVSYEWNQYTGIKDSKGNKIFEGDIIKDDTETLKVITFENGMFGCTKKRTASFYSDEKTTVFYGIYEYIVAGVEIEVVGNIYENPELLEVK